MQHKEVVQTKYYVVGYPNCIIGFLDDYHAAFNGLFGLHKQYSDHDMKVHLLNNIWTPNHSNMLGGIRVLPYETATSSTSRAHMTCQVLPNYKSHGPLMTGTEELSLCLLFNTLSRCNGKYPDG